MKDKQEITKEDDFEEKTIITEIKTPEEEKLENIIKNLEDINFSLSQTSATRIVNPSLKIADTILTSSLEQGLRNIPTEDNDKDNGLTQYGIQESYEIGNAGNYDSVGGYPDENQSYVSNIELPSVQSSFSIDNSFQQSANSTHGRSMYPGTRKKDKKYNPIIDQGNDEEKRRRERGRKLY